MGHIYSELEADYGKCDCFPFTNGSGSTLTGGTPHEVNDKVGLVYDDVDDGEQGILVTGIPSPGALLPKAGEAMQTGQPLYWDTSAGQFTVTSADGIEIGYVYAGAASGDDKVQGVLPDLNLVT